MDDELQKLFKDLSNYDPHFRQNSVRFLSQKYIKEHDILKDDIKDKIIDGLLSKLDIKEDSLEVKGATVREFGKMAKLLKEKEVIQIFSKIILYITDEKAIGKDIFVSCIKEILKKMHYDSCYTVGNTIIPTLKKGINSNNLVIKELCFDTFNDYLTTFNFVLIKENDSLISNKKEIYSSAINALKTDSVTLKKICSNFIGNLSLILKKDAYNDLISLLIKEIINDSSSLQKISYINSLSAIIKNTSSKQADYIPKILEIIFKYCNEKFLSSSMSSTEEYDHANELVEACLNILELYVMKNPKYLLSNIEKIIEILISLIKYDPNYNYNNESQSNQVIENQDYDEYYDYYDYNVYSNDDSSWKVRKSSVKVVLSLIKSRIEINKVQTIQLLENLSECIREHDENTKLEIINCISAYLKSFIIEEDNLLVKKISYLNLISSIIDFLIEKISLDIASSGSQLNIKIGYIKILISIGLVDASKAILFINSNSNSLLSLFKESNEAGLIVIQFFNKTLQTTYYFKEIQIINDCLIDFIKKGSEHDYYKIQSESFNLCSSYIKTISNNSSNKETHDFESIPKITHELYNIILSKLKINDTDQEMKYSVIASAGNLVLYLGVYINQSELSQVFSLFYEKRNNDNIRSWIFTWIINILKGNSFINIDEDMSIFIELLIDSLPKYTLKSQYQSLELMYYITLNCKKSMSKFIQGIDNCLKQLIKEESLLELIYSILDFIYINNKINENIIVNNIKNTLQLLKELNKPANKQIFQFLSNSIGIINKDTVSQLLDQYSSFENMNLNKAKSISIISKMINKHNQVSDSYISTIKTILSNNKVIDNENEKVIKNCLVCIGELSLIPSFDSVKVFEYLSNIIVCLPDKFKHNISLCIGKVSISCLNKFYDYILSMKKDKDNTAFEYISIRECFYELTQNKYNIDNKCIIDILKYIVNNEFSLYDDKLKSITGEIVGYAALISNDYLQIFKEYLESSDENIKSLALIGLKYIFSDKKYTNQEIDFLVNPLLNSISSTSLKIRQSGFYSLSDFAFNYPSVIRDKKLINQLWDIFKINAKSDESLIETVDLGGGIKIKNDKGHAIRKAIQLTVKIIIDKIPDKIIVPSTLEILIIGLKDIEDIQTICISSLKKLSSFAKDALCQDIETIIEIFMEKLKVLLEAEKNIVDENLKSKLFILEVSELISDLSKVEQISENAKFNEFKTKIENN